MAFNNHQNARTAEAAIESGPYHEDLRTNAQDFVTDLLHLSDREGWDFEQMFQAARNNYLAELSEAADNVKRKAYKK